MFALIELSAAVLYTTNHQGKGNVLLFPVVSRHIERQGPMQCHERLGGLLKYYTRGAA